MIKDKKTKQMANAIEEMEKYLKNRFIGLDPWRPYVRSFFAGTLQ